MKQFMCVFLGVVTLIACSKHGPDTNTNKADVFFMQQASYSNLAEINAGSIAAVRGSYDSVKMFGSMMIDDHTKAEVSLKSLADQLKVTIPDAPDSVHQAKAALLKTLSGHTFDTAYINGQVQDHMATIAVFQTELTDGYNSSVKSYVTKNLPVIKMHLTEALNIQAQIK